MIDRQKVFLHIGAMKTGTTYLQRVLLENRTALAEAGVQFPSDNGTWSLQMDGVREAITPSDRRTFGFDRNVAGAWKKLCSEVAAFPGTSVISMEFMSYVGPDGAKSLVEGFEGREVAVILGVRDALPIVPAVWQTGARNYGVGPWTEFLDELAGGREQGNPSWRRFQRTQGIPRMLRVWSSVVPPDRIHVLTVPPSGSPPERLWQRFASIIEVDPDVATTSPQAINQSLGHPSAELVRLVNQRLGRDRTGAERHTIRRVLAGGLLPQRKDLERPISGGSQLTEFAQRWNRRVLNAVEACGARLVGDAADLPTTLRTSQEAPTEPTVDELLGAAAFATENLLRLTRDPEPGGQPGWAALASEESWRSSPDPVDAAVGDVTRAVIAHAAT